MGNKSSSKKGGSSKADLNKSNKKGKKGDKGATDKPAETTKTPETTKPTPVTEDKPAVVTKTESKPKEEPKKQPVKDEDDDKGTVADVLCDEMNKATNATKKMTKDDFIILKVIGRGSFGKVMQVKKKDTGQVYAMKVMRKENIIAKNQVTHTKDEKNVLERIKHPFIVKLHYAFQTPEKLYMILDFVNGGELFFHLKKCGKFSEKRVILYAAEIASALMHLHNNGFVYRDLKPENLLLDASGHIVITDFGLSKEIKGEEGTHTFCGTPEYIAPEVLTGEGHSFPVDWWSLGTLIYEMLTGLPPFYSEVTSEMYQKIVNGDLIFPQDMSDSACDLLSGLLERDPDDRFGGEELMAHEWFAKIDWKLLLEKKIEPEWKPPVTDAFSVEQIDDYFLQEVAEDSIVKKKVQVAGGNDAFEGFTFDERGRK